MLIEYRDDIAPKIIGKKPDYLFVNVDGSRKDQSTLAHLISRHLKKREGILLSPHQFRHWTAKVMLNHSPGNFEGVASCSVIPASRPPPLSTPGSTAVAPRVTINISSMIS